MIDRYTKVVLTVIAVCVVYLAGKDVMSVAHAQQRVDVNIVAVNGIPVFFPLAVHPQ